MSCGDTKAIIDWLADGARPAAEIQDVLAQLCDRLVDCGIPLWRVGLFILTLHPQIMGRACIWTWDAPIFVDDAPFERFETEEFRASPVRRAIDSGHPIRRRLADADCPTDFTQTRDLKAQGATDYLVEPLTFADGARHAASFATRQPGGFTDEHAAGIKSIIGPLARVAENRTLQRTARTLLDTYVGSHAGARVLAGQIRRGDTSTIHAAIWLSDMRGFTRLADRLPPQTLVDLLNRYFDCQVPPILAHGGEVLKFMGDGLLAIFAVESGGGNIREVCLAALMAARAAQSKLTAAFAGNGAAGDVRFGLALHLGDILYGNIGSGNRLDFTCIGPAVNLAARIEKLTGELGRSILASEAFARHFPSKFAPVGEFALRGFGSAHTVFGLQDEVEPVDSMNT